MQTIAGSTLSAFASVPTQYQGVLTERKSDMLKGRDQIKNETIELKLGESIHIQGVKCDGQSKLFVYMQQKMGEFGRDKRML